MNRLVKILFLSVLLFISFSFNARAAREDMYSWTWWSTQSGLTSGTIVDIINQYLTSLGYSGDTTDMFHSWLVDETGQVTTWTTDDLSYYYFVTLNSCGLLDPCGGGGGLQLTFLSSNLTFLGSNLTFQ